MRIGVARASLLLATLVSVRGGAQEVASDLERVCAEMRCRPATQVKLAGVEKVVPIDRTPFFRNGMGNVLPGEKLYLEADEKAGRLENIRFVPAVADPKRTMVFSFEQSKDKKLAGHMLLTVKNPFSKALKFSAGIRRLSDGNVVKTSSCPVGPGQQNFEDWPDPIPQLFVKDLRFLEADAPDATSCK
jgi:hypothetical protein